MFTDLLLNKFGHRVKTQTRFLINSDIIARLRQVGTEAAEGFLERFAGKLVLWFLIGFMNA